LRYVAKTVDIVFYIFFNIKQTVTVSGRNM